MEQNSKKSYFSPELELIAVAEDVVTGSTSIGWDSTNWGDENGDFN
ncbi:MAG: hypothetical protein IKD47_00435 [Clostridia bacterium]|nr:hypothetical protein [Clostridia bacterium]